MGTTENFVKVQASQSCGYLGCYRQKRARHLILCFLRFPSTTKTSLKLPTQKENQTSQKTTPKQIRAQPSLADKLGWMLSALCELLAGEHSFLFYSCPFVSSFAPRSTHSHIMREFIPRPEQLGLRYHLFGRAR